ncbi:MAG: Na/Pi cotransporter family protein [Clostridia bacterium]|nr:Na/Pi cotransporter family protein [Clostridia bacterium]
MEYLNIIIPFAGGLGMFIYGMQIMSQGLENAAGDKMKALLEILTKNKILGVLLGAVITAIIQSSSATTVMVVGFVNAGIMNLMQAMGVIMGANIGTTITGWLVSSSEWANFLKPDTLAPVALVIGVVTMLVGKKSRTKDISSIIVGFGLLFIGISAMSDGVAPLREMESFTNLFVTLGGNPFLSILIGAIVTGVIQSSSASVGILQSLAAAGLVPFNAAIYIIMGQNIGTCVTAMISSMGAKKNAKTAALMHLLFNVIGTGIFSIASIAFFKIVDPVWSHGNITQTQISLVHTLFNIITTILLFPFSNLIVKLAKKISGVKEEKYRTDSVLLDDRMLQTPPLALRAINNEIFRMGEAVIETLDITKNVLFTKSDSDIEKIRECEERVDTLCDGITQYALKISGLQISEKEHQHIARMLQVISDMERISDYCENISEYAETMKKKNLAFSDGGTAELKEMLNICAECFTFALNAFEDNDKEKAFVVIEKETRADELEISLRTKHIKRLAKNQCDIESGIVFLDTVVALERISDHARNIAEEVLEEI